MFAPRLIRGYHKKHPLSEPFPHKRTLLRLGRTIPPVLPPCLTSRETPPTSPLPQLLHPCPSFMPLPLISPSKSTPTKYTPSTHLQSLPQSHHPLTKLKSPSQTRLPLVWGSLSSKSLGLEELLKTSEKQPRTLLAPSQSESKIMNRLSLTSGEKTPTRRTPSPTSTDASEKSKLDAPKRHHHPQGLSRMTVGSPTSTSPSKAPKPEPDTSGSPSQKASMPKAPWEGRAPKSTPPLSKPCQQPIPTTPPPLNPSPSGSSTSSTLQKPTLESYLRGRKSSTTGGSPLTWPTIGGTATRLTISTQPGRGSMPALPPVKEHRISPSTASALPEQLRGFVTSNDWETPWEISAEKSSQGTNLLAIPKHSGEPEVGLPSKQRVMSLPRL